MLGVAAGVPRRLFLWGAGTMCTPRLLTLDPPCVPLRWGALTEVGELHSLTDWQVSEASEDAELEDFCHAEASRRADGAGRPGGEERTDLVTAPACSGVLRLGAPPAPPASICGRSQHPERTRRAPADSAAQPKSQRQ